MSKTPLPLIEADLAQLRATCASLDAVADQLPRVPASKVLTALCHLQMSIDLLAEVQSDEA